ncbi:MAG TPA: ABC transporter ATP-binding protein [Planctomycetota bacterium]|nr:ABC transporter ATP-binding protein [Planctomycetota bacterium]
MKPRPIDPQGPSPGVPGVASLWRMRQTLAFVWRSWPGWAVASGVLIVVGALLPLAFLYAIKLLVDLIAAGPAPAGGAVDEALAWRMLSLVGLAASIALLQSLATAAGRWIGEAQAQAVTDYMFGILHDKSVQVDLGYYENPEFKDKLHRAQREAPYRPKRIVNSLLEVAQNGVTVLTMAGLLCAFHWSVLPVLVASCVPGVLLRLRTSSQYYSWERKATLRERQSAYTNLLLTTVEFAKELRLFGLGAMLRGRFGALRDALRGEKLAVTRRRSVAEFAGEALAILGVFGVLAAMGYEALAGAISVGSLIMFHGGLQKAWSSLGQMLRSISMLYEDNLFVSDLFEFLEVEPQVRSPAEPRPLPPPRESGLRFEHVSFRYPHDEREVLRDVDFELRPGEHVALVGHNGCGKTTLVKLICRLYDPTGGVIRFGGVDLRELELGAWRHEIGVLMQDYCRYQMTLRENVWLGDIALDPRDARVERAVVDARAEALVARLPEGLESMLGSTFLGGHELSTGQWQKIALARMLARDAPILVLDEPTSAMDAEAEAELIGKLRQVAVGRTTLVISHRLAAIRRLDRIVYLHEGRVAESGTHDELVALGGGYARLFELQSQHYR